MQRSMSSYTRAVKKSCARPAHQALLQTRTGPVGRHRWLLRMRPGLAPWRCPRQAHGRAVRTPTVWEAGVHEGARCTHCLTQTSIGGELAAGYCAKQYDGAACLVQSLMKAHRACTVVRKPKEQDDWASKRPKRYDFDDHMRCSKQLQLVCNATNQPLLRRNKRSPKAGIIDRSRWQGDEWLHTTL